MKKFKVKFRYDSPKCSSCNSKMNEREGFWVCPYCQGEPGSIKKKTNNVKS